MPTSQTAAPRWSQCAGRAKACTLRYPGKAKPSQREYVDQLCRDILGRDVGPAIVAEHPHPRAGVDVDPRAQPALEALIGYQQDHPFRMRDETDPRARAIAMVKRFLRTCGPDIDAEELAKHKAFCLALATSEHFPSRSPQSFVKTMQQVHDLLPELSTERPENPEAAPEGGAGLDWTLGQPMQPGTPPEAEREEAEDLPSEDSWAEDLPPPLPYMLSVTLTDPVPKAETDFLAERIALLFEDGGHGVDTAELENDRAQLQKSLAAKWWSGKKVQKFQQEVSLVGSADSLLDALRAALPDATLVLDPKEQAPETVPEPQPRPQEARASTPPRSQYAGAGLGRGGFAVLPERPSTPGSSTPRVSSAPAWASASDDALPASPPEPEDRFSPSSTLARDDRSNATFQSTLTFRGDRILAPAPLHAPGRLEQYVLVAAAQQDGTQPVRATVELDSEVLGVLNQGAEFTVVGSPVTNSTGQKRVQLQSGGWTTVEADHGKVFARPKVLDSGTKVQVLCGFVTNSAGELQCEPGMLGTITGTEPTGDVLVNFDAFDVEVWVFADDTKHLREVVPVAAKAAVPSIRRAVSSLARSLSPRTERPKRSQTTDIDGSAARSVSPRLAPGSLRPVRSPRGWQLQLGDEKLDWSKTSEAGSERTLDAPEPGSAVLAEPEQEKSAAPETELARTLDGGEALQKTLEGTEELAQTLEGGKSAASTCTDWSGELKLSRTGTVAVPPVTPTPEIRHADFVARSMSHEMMVEDRHREQLLARAPTAPAALNPFDPFADAQPEKKASRSNSSFQTASSQSNCSLPSTTASTPSRSGSSLVGRAMSGLKRSLSPRTAPRSGSSLAPREEGRDCWMVTRRSAAVHLYKKATPPGTPRKGSVALPFRTSRDHRKVEVDREAQMLHIYEPDSAATIKHKVCLANVRACAVPSDKSQCEVQVVVPSKQYFFRFGTADEAAQFVALSR